MTARPRLLSSTPLLVVADLQRAIDFYCGRLGFTDCRAWGEPPCFAMMHRDGFELMLSLAGADVRPTPNGPTGVWDMYLRVADVAAEQAALRAAGVALAKGPVDTEYAMREIEVVDPDGHRVCFGQDLGRPPDEAWDGVLDTGRARLRLRLRLRDEAGTLRGVLDSLDQGAMNLPIDTLERTATALRFSMLALQAEFAGVVSADGRSVSGRWTQRGMGWPLTLERA